jgi:uncharacterized lipoprotein YddW (UPF0748 family)
MIAIWSFLSLNKPISIDAEIKTKMIHEFKAGFAFTKKYRFQLPYRVKIHDLS